MLRQLHTHLAPARCLEIGTQSGTMLRLSTATLLAIDPSERRPDLRIFGVPTPPTGLILVTNLDPHSHSLPDGSFDAVAQFAQAGPAEFRHLLASVTMLDQPVLSSLEQISRRF